MATSSRRKQKNPPTRLAAAWVVFVGALGGLALAVVLMPEAPPSVEPFIVKIPPTPDRYAAAVANEAARRPVMNQKAVADLMADDENAHQSEAMSDSAPVLKLTPVESEVPILSLDQQYTSSNAPEKVVITVSGQPVPEEAAPRRVGPSAPDPSLMAQTASGNRPAIGASGKTPFDAYRRPDIRLASAPEKSVAILVSGLGLDEGVTTRAIATLPPEVTLSFAPYSARLKEFVELAVAKGHEVVIEVPMEQGNVGVDALGSAALRTTQSEAANRQRLDWILSRTDAYPMVTNYLGSTFSQDAGALRPVMEDVRDAGLAYLDDTGFGAAVAAQVGVPYGSVVAVIPPGTSDVELRIGRAAETAAIDPKIIKVYAGSGGLEGVLSWVQSDARKQITLVPASSAVRR